MNKNIQNKIKLLMRDINRFVVKDLPRIVGKEAVDEFRGNFQWKDSYSTYENKQFFFVRSSSFLYGYKLDLIRSISYRGSKASFRDTEHILSAPLREGTVDRFSYS